MDLLLVGLSAFSTIFVYQFGRYRGKHEALPEALEMLQRKLTWKKNVGAAQVYRTLWPKAGYTSEDDAHELGFYAGYNAREQSAAEIVSKT